MKKYTLFISFFALFLLNSCSDSVNAEVANPIDQNGSGINEGNTSSAPRECKEEERPQDTELYTYSCVLGYWLAVSTGNVPEQKDDLGYSNPIENFADECSVGDTSTIDGILHTCWPYQLHDGAYWMPTPTTFNESLTYGTLRDSRDNRMYRTIKIGSYTWMAENLKYAASESYCYAATMLSPESLCENYGRLYTYSAAKEVCPEGWHLSTMEEWEDLIAATGSDDPSQIALILSSSAKWYDWNGVPEYRLNTLGFSVVPAGFRDKDGYYYDINSQTLFWTSSGENVGITSNFFRARNNAASGFSVRCVQGDAPDEFIPPDIARCLEPNTGCSCDMEGKVLQTSAYNYCHCKKELNNVLRWSCAFQGIGIH